MEVITANSLADGRVVFQSLTGWVHDINAAEVLLTKEGAAVALARASADAAHNVVVEPYAITVRQERSGLVAVRLREAIRASGPTTGNSKHTDAAAPDAAS